MKSVFWIFFFIPFISDTKLREKCSCIKIYLESEGGNQDEKSNSENQDYTAQDQSWN